MVAFGITFFWNIFFFEHSQQVYTSYIDSDCGFYISFIKNKKLKGNHSQINGHRTMKVFQKNIKSRTMKKLLILFALVFFSMTSHAQLSFRVGMTAPKILLENHSPNLGLNVGILKAFGGGGFQFITGVIFTQKGTKIDFNGLETKVRVNYIDIPLNLSYGINLGLSSRVFVEIGPYIGLALNGKEKVGDFVPKVLEIGKDINWFAGGMNIGLNFRFSRVQIGLGYNRSITSILKSNIQSSVNQYSSVNLSYVL